MSWCRSSFLLAKRARNRVPGTRTAAWFLLLGGLLLPAASAGGGGAEVPGRIVLELSEEAAAELRAGTLRLPIPHGGERLEPVLRPLFTSRRGPLARYALLTFRPEAAEAGANREWLEAMRASAAVRRAEPDVLLEMAALPDDPYLTGVGGVPEQFHLRNPGGTDLAAWRAWPFVPAGSEAVVAVLDSGVDWRHEDLGGANPPVTGVLWRNEAELAGTAGVDDDANGFVDDFIGWDFVDLPRDFPGGISVHPGDDDADEDNDPSDYAGHGTYVAGLVTAITDNGLGLAGGASGVRLMPLRVGWLTATGIPVVYMSYAAKAVEYAMLNGADVANCSWDSQDVLGLGAAIDAAVNEHEMVIVASAGNEGTDTPSGSHPQYLGSRDDCLAVAGVRESLAKASGSNYGSWVEITAYYVGMPSLGFDRGTGESQYRVDALGGTSWAAPQISGLAGLLRAAAPEASSGSVRAWIENTGQDLSTVEPDYAWGLGGGLADYAAAVQAAAGGWDAARGASALTPYGENAAAAVAHFAADALFAVGAADGDALSGWVGGQAASGGDLGASPPLVTTWPDAASPVLVWREGTLLHAAPSAGTALDGWPVTVPVTAGAPAAAVEDGEPRIYVPYGGGVLVIAPDEVSGVATSTLAIPVENVCVGQLDADAPLEVAGISATGFLFVHDPDASGVPGLWSVNVGPTDVPPVMGEFTAPGEGVVVVAAPYPPDPVDTQRLLKIGNQGMSMVTVQLAAPRLRALSLVGFGGDARVEAVVVDENGDIHFFDDAGPVLSAGGPIAGEVLCADVDGDDESDLVAMRTDGTLLAWESGLDPVEGFPRRFPASFTEAPVVGDADGVRYLLAVDVDGRLWSLPVGGADRSAPWPAVRGGPLRNGFLGHERATPVEVAAARLTWSPESGGGRLCWGGVVLGEHQELRVRWADETTALWQGAVTADGCAGVATAREGRLVLEGLGRAGGWRWLGTASVAAPGLVLAGPYPNPFTASTRIAWSGGEGTVRVEVFDVRGRLLAFARRDAAEGGYEWDGRDEAGRPMPPGLYLVRVQGAGRAASRRVLKTH